MKLKQLPEDFIVEEIPLYELRDNGIYFLYLLKKKNKNTEDVIQELSKLFKVPRKFFSYSGNKDKKAVTIQYFTVKKELSDIKKKDYEIKKIGKCEKPLSLGDLKGNNFKIIVRDIANLPDYKEEFINYFGDQRFGRHNLDIGFAILKKDFKTAASFIDIEDVQKHLLEKPKDYIGAIQKVPFKVLKIYVHSVQSFLWNKAAEILDEDEIPLIAFDTEFSKIEIKRVYEKLLNQYELGLMDFVIRHFQNLTPKGSIRKRVVKAENLKITRLENDDLNKGKKKVKIEFFLPKGSYATVFIEEMFKKK